MIEGRRRKVLMQAPKNGFFYVLDRASGELISAEPFVPVSWASHVDLASGRPVERAEALWSQQSAMVTPGPTGAHNWHPMSYSPRTGLVYIPSLSSVYPYTPDPDYVYQPRVWNTGENLVPPMELAELLGGNFSFCTPSHITAWDPVRQKRAFRVDHQSTLPGGLLSTAGDLLFQGTGDGVFAAYDANSGERLWSTDVGIGIMAPPISYEIAGEQYVAVLAGMGGTHGGHYTHFDYENDGRLLAWKLGGRASLPELRKRPAKPIEAPAQSAAPATIAKGRKLYARYCIFCHGVAAISSGLHPDLRHASLDVHRRWNAIVLGGVRQDAGMPSFADRLDSEAAAAIQSYAIWRARHQPGLLETALGWLQRHACLPAHWIAD